MVRQLLALALAALLGACGGGEETAAVSTAEAQARPGQALQMPAPLRAALEQAIPPKAAIAAGGPLTADEAMNWAEQNIPDLFPPAGKLSGFSTPYSYRYYPGSQTYLGVAIASDDVAVFIYSVHTGWTMRRIGALVDFSCTIKPQSCEVSVGTPSMALAVTEGGSAQQDFDIETHVPGTITLSKGAPASWLTVVRTGTTTARVTASAAGMPPGSYDSSVVVQFQPANGAASFKTIPVSFTIGPGLIAPAAQARVLDAQATLASLGGSVAVASGDATSRAWTASSSAAWLKLGATSGNTPATLQYSVDANALGSLANFQSHTATVTISSNSASPVSFQLTLDKQLPQLTTVMPYGIPAGSKSRVVVRGTGFSQISGTPSITGVSASNVVVQSDSQLAFDVTPASQGSFDLRVGNASGVAAGKATLQVSAADAYQAGSSALAGNKEVAIHDPIRKAIFAVGRYNENALYKYQYSGGKWTAAAALAISGPDSLALSPDGSRLFVTQPVTSTIKEVNPDTMTVVATHTSSIAGNNYSTPLAVSVDNRLWVPGSYYSGSMLYLDLNDNTFRNVQGALNVESAAYVGSADGSVVMVSPDFCCTPRRSWHLYRSADGSVTNPMGTLDLSYYMRVSNDGSRVLQQWSGEVYDNTWNLLGQLPDNVSGEYYGRMAITPDGKRLIALVYQGNYTATFIRIDVYSTSSLSPGTTRFAKVGSIPVTTQASVCPPSGYDCTTFGYLLPSMDNKAVFWIGNAAIQTYKLP